MHRHPRSAAPAAAVLTLALALAGCGTTVPGGAAGARGAEAGAGLGGPAAPGGSGGTPVGGEVGPGASGPGSPAGVPGSGRGPGGSRPGTDPLPPVGGSAAEDRTPLVLGILDQGSANAAAQALGANYSTSASGADVTRAMVRWYNKHGGIAGRQIKAVQYTVEVTSPSYQTEFQAACARFTQDTRVAAVISVLANAYYENYEACLAKAGVPNIAGPTGGTDDHDLAAYPTLVSATAPSTNRRFQTLIDRSVAERYLTRSNKLGIIVEGCAYNLRAYERTIAPLARKHGLSVTRRDINCLQGFADAGAYVNQVGSAVLPFRTAGIDRVLFVSNFEGVALLSFENAASAQGYTPSYALTSTTGGASLAGQFASGQLARMRGVGWTPVLDVTRRVLASPTTKRCRAMLASEGIRPRSKADDLLDIVCDQFFLLERVLQASRGVADRATFLRSLRSLGQSYLSAYTLRGATSFATRRDGPRLFATWGYRPSCGCMDYLSAPAPS